MVGFFDPVSKKWIHREFPEESKAQAYLDAADDVIGPLTDEQKYLPEPRRVP